jgi:anti-sigma B factor antagonist
MPLNFSIEMQDDTPLVRWAGSIIESDDDAMKEGMDPLFKKDYQRIILDVSQVNFINSHGLGVLVYYHNQMQKQNRTFIIRNSNPRPDSYLRRLFIMTRLDQVLNIEDSEAA